MPSGNVVNIRNSVVLGALSNTKFFVAGQVLRRFLQVLGHSHTSETVRKYVDIDTVSLPCLDERRILLQALFAERLDQEVVSFDEPAAAVKGNNWSFGFRPGGAARLPVSYF